MLSSLVKVQNKLSVYTRDLMLMIPKADIFYFQASEEYKHGARSSLKAFQVRGSSKTNKSRKDELYITLKNSCFILMGPISLSRS